MFNNRKFVLVDTAGLTKITPNFDLIKNSEEIKKTQQLEATGKYPQKLPGMNVICSKARNKPIQTNNISNNCN